MTETASGLLQELAQRQEPSITNLLFGRLAGGKGDHVKGKEHSTNAQQHSQNARLQFHVEE
jgi:hypothetical protein